MHRLPSRPRVGGRRLGPAPAVAAVGLAAMLGLAIGLLQPLIGVAVAAGMSAVALAVVAIGGSRAAIAWHRRSRWLRSRRPVPMSDQRIQREVGLGLVAMDRWLRQNTPGADGPAPPQEPPVHRADPDEGHR